MTDTKNDEMADARAALTYHEPDRPADAGEPSADQARFERVWKQLAYSMADFFALEVTDAQARSIAREVLQSADAGEPSCCARTREEALQNAANRCQDHGIEAAKEMMGHPAGSDKRERLQAKLGAHGLDVNSILNLCGKPAIRRTENAGVGREGR